MTQKLSDILCLGCDREEESLLLHTVSVKSQQVASLQNVEFPPPGGFLPSSHVEVAAGSAPGVGLAPVLGSHAITR